MKSRSRDGGLSLVELIIAMAILAVAIMALVSSITSSSQIQQSTREKTLAYNAAREQIEKMRVYAVQEIYSRYNSVTTDDNNYPSGGVSGHPGNTFHVPRLAAPSTIPGVFTLPTAWSVNRTDRAWTDTKETNGITPISTDTFGNLLGNDGVGTIVFPESGGSLTETYVDSAMGMPKDLNRNGTAADTNVNSTYKILPVKIKVRWKMIGGKDTEIEVNTFITDK